MTKWIILWDCGSNRLDCFFCHQIFGLTSYGLIFFTGFSQIMGTLAKIGFFCTEPSLILKDGIKPTHRAFLLGLVGIDGQIFPEPVIDEKYITDRILKLGLCKDKDTAVKTAKTIM